MTTATPAPPAKPITGHGSSRSAAIAGSDRAATMDASEAYRKTMKTRIQTPAPIPPTTGATPRNAPPQVAGDDKERRGHFRLLRVDLVLRHPVVDRRPVEIVEECIDVGRAVGPVVEEVRVLVDVESNQRRCVPDRERVLCVADVVEETALVPVVRRPGPASPGHAGRLEVGPPILHRAKVALDQVADLTARIAAAPAEVLEIDLVVLDPADGERQVDLERANLGVGLICTGDVDAVELLQDFVPLVDVALVELEVRLDGFARDAVELVELGLELPGRDLLELEGKRGH